MKWLNRLPLLLAQLEKGSTLERDNARDNLAAMAAAADDAQKLPRMGSMDYARASMERLKEKHPDKVVYATRHPASGEWTTGATTKRTFASCVRPRETPGNLWVFHRPGPEAPPEALVKPADPWTQEAQRWFRPGAYDQHTIEAAAACLYAGRPMPEGCTRDMCWGVVASARRVGYIVNPKTGEVTHPNDRKF